MTPLILLNTLSIKYQLMAAKNDLVFNFGCMIKYSGCYQVLLEYEIRNESKLKRLMEILLN